MRISPISFKGVRDDLEKIHTENDKIREEQNALVLSTMNDQTNLSNDEEHLLYCVV